MQLITAPVSLQPIGKASLNFSLNYSMVEWFTHSDLQVDISVICLPHKQHGEEEEEEQVPRCLWLVPPRCWCCPTLLCGQSCSAATTFAGVWLRGVHHPNTSPAATQSASYRVFAAASPGWLRCSHSPGLVYLLPPLINFVWVGRTSPLRLSVYWRPLLRWCLKASAHKKTLAAVSLAQLIKRPHSEAAAQCVFIV